VADALIITVRGTPAPQGSKRHVGGGRMIEMSKAVGPWREAVRAETQRVMCSIGPPFGFGDAVAVEIDFYMARPKSTPRKTMWPAKRPDVDKLARAVLDGLTDGGAWLDDGQVVRLRVEKHYADAPYPPHSPGCTIVIVPMHETMHDLKTAPAQKRAQECT
jgi:crossover junction endodeoxyribonuclease RusA